MTSLRTTLTFVLILMLTQGPVPVTAQTYSPVFDGASALIHLVEQCSFGPRPPGSENLSLCRQYMVMQLEEAGWNVTLQNFTHSDVLCTNIIANWGNGSASFVVGAHYDTRPKADQDPTPANRDRPILGANDGASGTAVLLELAASLPSDVRFAVELVFFDAEDSGYIPGWDWILGSTHYVEQLNGTERDSLSAMVLLDMVGDKDLVLLREMTSTRSVQDSVWAIASELGYEQIFRNESGSSILDDHRPFLQAGIPAVDIIQHGPFPSYWHTLEDTPDKCSAGSLDAVGEVVETFLVISVLYGQTFTTTPSDPTVYLLLLAIPPCLVIGIYLVSRRRRTQTYHTTFYHPSLPY